MIRTTISLFPTNSDRARGRGQQAPAYLFARRSREASPPPHPALSSADVPPPEERVDLDVQSETFSLTYNGLFDKIKPR
jgi:hypothetical protein